MRVKAEQLRNHLKGGIRAVYFIFGDEPLQIRECTDMLRKAARYYEYEEREVYTADAHFDWQQLQYAAAEMSLFASKKLIDLHLPNGKPGDKGIALMAYLENIPEDTILLIHAGKLESATTRSKWFKALDKQAVVVQVWPLKEQQLKQWLVNRLHRHGLQLQPDALQFLFQQVEGNLLSADQEIIKLALLHIDESQAGKTSGNKPGQALVLNLEQVADSVSDSSIYNTFDLFDTALKGDTIRVIKMLDVFAAEGQAIAFLLWMVTKEIRLLAILSNQAKTMGVADAMAKTYIFQQRKPLLAKILQQKPEISWHHFLLLAAHIDYSVKGVEKGEPWAELKQLLVDISEQLK